MSTTPKAVDLVERLADLRGRKPVGNALLDLLHSGALTVDHLRGLVQVELTVHQGELVAYGTGTARFPRRPNVHFMTQLIEVVDHATPKLVECARAFGLGEEELRRRVPDPALHGFNGYLSWVSSNESQASLALALHTDMSVYFPEGLALARGVKGSDLEVPEEFFAYYGGESPDELMSLALEVVDDGLARGDDPDDAVFHARMLEEYVGQLWRSAAGIRSRTD